MESSSKEIVVTPEFLGSAFELTKQQGREVLMALRKYLASPDDSTHNLEPSTGSGDRIRLIHAGALCRIVFSVEPDVKLLFVGLHETALRFVEHGNAIATAFTEVPIAFQLHIDFWETGQAAAYESPSCGAPISTDSLDRLILRGRRYLPLAQLLLSRGPEVALIELSFREIEMALRTALPKTARTRSSWWANDPSHAQAVGWLAIGWEATGLNLRKETIAFVRSAREPAG